MQGKIFIWPILILLCALPFTRAADSAEAQQTPSSNSTTTETSNTTQQTTTTSPTPVTDESANTTNQTTTTSGSNATVNTTDNANNTNTTTTAANTTTASPVETISPIPDSLANQYKYGGLLLPQVRKDTNFAVGSSEICGGTYRERSRYITTQNVSNEFKWLIETPSSEGKCFFRVTSGVEQNDDTVYTPLIPQDDQRNITSEDGWFDCGRAKGVEKMYFKFPETIDCDACILEWIWKTPDFQMRQCADISVLSEQTELCRGICENGGVCHSGVCVCKEGYIGDYCEVRTYSPVRRALNNLPHIAFYFVLAIIVIMGLVGIVVWWKKKDERDNSPTAATGQRRYEQFDNDAAAGGRPKPAVQLAVRV